MADVRNPGRTQSEPDATTRILFQEEWQIYRKLVENNYAFHREVYAQLNRVLAAIPRPFRFLDIACGDASASAGALKGTNVAHYRGIDLSEAALAMAAQNLAGLDCPVVLEKGDFIDTIRARPEPADVIWIGLSLHHLLQPAKLDFMESIRALLPPGGLFMIYENASPDGEDRTAWLVRWDKRRPLWKEYTAADWDAMRAHVHAADFPETDATWRRLGREAGFGETEELFRAPSDLFRLYAFTA
jgi:SAM-dependent methyltransferase